MQYDRTGPVVYQAKGRSPEARSKAGMPVSGRGASERSEPRAERSVPYNRLRMVMIHTSRYAFQGQARLAADAGVSRSTISRLLNRKTSPSYALASAVTAALAKQLGRPLDVCELISPSGTYPTRSGCTLAGCRGCLPEGAYDPQGNRWPAWKNARPGEWSCTPEPPSSSPAPTP